MHFVFDLLVGFTELRLIVEYLSWSQNMLEIKGAETGNMPLASTGFPNVRINLKHFFKNGQMHCLLLAPYCSFSKCD